MKKLLLLMLMLALVLFSNASFVQAALIVNGDGTITDTDINIMWLESAGPDANWADATAWADALVFAGFDNWRLPSALDFDTSTPDVVWNSINNEWGHLYGFEWDNPPNLASIAPMNYDQIWWWTGTADTANPGDAFAFFWSFDNLWLNDTSADYPWTTEDALHATAVRDLTADEIESVGIFMTDRSEEFGYIFLDEEPPPDTCPPGTTGTPPNCVPVDGQVPEPATILLFGTGLFGLGFFSRKKRRG